MRFRVDLRTCQSMGQCSFTAPDLFPLNDDGVLAFADQNDEEFVSEELSHDDGRLAEEASLLCPMRAISMQ